MCHGADRQAVVDVVAIAGVQVTMVGALAAHYGVPYNRERVGHVFIAHFESGGTPLDLDIDQARERVSAALSRG